MIKEKDKVTHVNDTFLRGTVTKVFSGVVGGVWQQLYTVKWQKGMCPMAWTCENTGKKGYSFSELILCDK